MISIQRAAQSRTRKAIMNIAAQALPEIVSEISGFILPRLMLVTFGSVLNGLVSSINQFIRYLRQLEAGLSTASTVSLYKPLAQKDDQKIMEVMSASRHFYRQVGITFSIGASILAAVYPMAVSVENYPWYNVAALVAILAGSGAVGFFISSAYQALFIADQRSYVVSVITAAFALAAIPAIVIVVRTGNLLAVQGTSLALAVVQAVVIRSYARISYKEKAVKNRPFAKGILAVRWDVFINETSLLIETNSPAIIATLILGLKSVSVYAIYNMIFTALQSVSRMSRNALRSSFGEVWALKMKEVFDDAYSQYEWMLFAGASVLYTTAAILLQPFISLYTRGVTDAEYIRPVLGVCFVIIGMIRQLQLPASVVIGASGSFKGVRKNNIFVAALSVSLGVLGAWTYGLEGVLLGLTAAAICKTGYSIYFVNRKVLTCGMKRTSMRLLRLLMASMAACVPFAFFRVHAADYFQWMLWGCVVFLWVAGVHAGFALVYERETMRKLLHRFVQNKTGKQNV